MCSRSTWSSAAGDSAARGVDVSAARARDAGIGTSAANAPASSRSEMTEPSAIIAARSMAFFNSRTLPSHRAPSSMRSALEVRPDSGLCMRCAHSRTKIAVRYGMSSRRSRSGGSATSTTFRR